MRAGAAGFCGLFHRDGRPVAAREVEGMARRLPGAHSPFAAVLRGPAAVAARPVADPATPRAPRAPGLAGEPSGRFWVAGELDLVDRAELAARVAPERPPAELSDADLLLAAWQRWGEAAVDRLRGAFAFALWDARDRRFTCARDALGEHPFFFHLAPHRFACGSRIPAVLAAPGVAAELDEAMIADYLTGELGDASLTFYRAVARLPAGHRLVVGEGTARLERWWRPDLEPAGRPPTDAAAAERFRAAFERAVARRLAGGALAGGPFDEGPGASGGAVVELSGGLDSAAVACTAAALAHRAGRVPPTAVSVVFAGGDPRADESRWIDAVADRWPALPWHRLDGWSLARPGALDALLAVQDEPWTPPNLLVPLAIHRFAAERGLPLVLDGLDGDATVSHGLGRLPELLLSGRWLRLGTELLLLARRFEVSPALFVRQHCIAPLRPEAPERGLASAGLAHRVGLEERLRRARGDEARARRGTRSAHWHLLTNPAAGVAFELRGRLAAGAGVAVRHPFGDRDLVELCLALPADQKLRAGWTRWVMRRGLAGSLPSTVRRRGGKAPLDLDFLRRLVASEDERLRELEAGVPPEAAPYVDAGALARAVAGWRSGGSVGDVFALWLTMSLTAWLRGIGEARNDHGS